MDKIGTAQRAKPLPKKTSDKMRKNSRIKASPTEDDLRDYMSVVMNELKLGDK